MNKRTIVLIALLLFVSLAIASTSFAEDEDRSYYLDFADIHIYVQEDGKLHIVETINYAFIGTWNGVTRDIPIKSDERIENLNVSISGAYGKYETWYSDGEEHIKVYLYSNPEKTRPISNTHVNVTYEYDFINIVNLYKDGATLHYTLWGPGWDVSLYDLNASIHLNNKNDVRYWLNPSKDVESSNWNNNTLEANTYILPSGNLVELRMIIPKDYFTNPTYALKHNEEGVVAFENLQNEYEFWSTFFEDFYYLLAFIALILCFIPLVIYFKYGREPKISYKGDYEREVPTNDSPAIVNALYKGGEIGSADMDAFKASILSLVNKKYLKMENFENQDSNSDEENHANPTIVFNTDLNLSDLPSSEKSAFKTLKLFADKNEKLDLEVFKNDMENETSAKKFREYYDSWCKEVENKAEENIERFFDSTGHSYAILVAIVGLILSGIIILLAFFNWLPYSYSSSFILFISSMVILGIVSIVSLALPNHIFGRWTVEGRENSKKWSNFKKYLKDFSLIKEYPPSSLTIWNQYLVYATTLGVAKNVQKHMEKLIPRETLDSMDSYYFYTYGGTYFLFSSFDSGVSTANSSDSSGGSGGFGGGSGGGGGGAF